MRKEKGCFFFLSLSECGCVRRAVMMTQLKRISDCCDVTSGSRNIGAIKRPGGPSPVADCFLLARIRRARVCAQAFVYVSICPRVSLCVPVCVHVCSGADDRGRGLHTRGTANEKEAFPLTFHGSQKQFTQWKVAKQPQCFSTEPGRRRDETRMPDFPPWVGCIGRLSAITL